MVQGESGSLLSQDSEATASRSGSLGGPERTRCAVLGSPIEHSLSPALHTAAYAYLGLDWTYERFRLETGELAGFLAGLDDTWRGFSVTMPLKAVLLDHGRPDAIATLVGAGNTLLLPERRVANTDVPGLVNAFTGAGVFSVESATIIGSGATARSALASLAGLGAAQVHMMARSPDKVAALGELAEAVGVRLVPHAWGDVPAGDVAVATTTAGVLDELAEAVAARHRCIFDVVYHPWPTRLAQVAAGRGRTVLNGLDLLVHQAVLQVELMTGRAVPAKRLLSAGRAQLRESR